MKLSKDDKFYEIKLSSIKTETDESMEAAEKYKEKKMAKKRTLYDYVERHDEAYRNNKIKSLIDFDEEYSSSIKSLAVKKDTKINLTTRFLNGKMLMFSKTWIQSFVYDLIDIFMFPTDDVKEIYCKNKIQKCFLYQNLTDTNSTFLSFVFIRDVSCNRNEKILRDIIFQVLVVWKVLSKLDVSDDFWAQYGAKSWKNKLCCTKLKILITQIF